MNTNEMNTIAAKIAETMELMDGCYYEMELLDESEQTENENALGYFLFGEAEFYGLSVELTETESGYVAAIMDCEGESEELANLLYEQHAVNTPNEIQAFAAVALRAYALGIAGE